MAASTINFGNLVAPDVAEQQLQLQRQQQLVDMLRQQSITPTPTETAGGMAVRQSPFAGLAKLASAYLSGQRQNDIDAKTLGLNREMAARYAQILGGGAPADSPAPIQPNASAALGQGAAAGSVGPTVANAQRMDAMPASDPAPQPPAGGNFNMANLLRGGVVSQLGGDAAGSAYWDQFKQTDGQKTDRYLGITPDQSRASELAKRLKAGYIPPTRLAPGVYSDPIAGIQGLPAPPQPGFQNIKNPDGTWGTVPIGNGPAAVRTAAREKAAGEGDVQPYAGVDGQGNPLPVTNRTAAATQGTAPAPVGPQPLVQPQSGVSGNFKGDPAKVSADIEAIPDPQQRANARAAFEAQMKASNGVLPPMPGPSAVYAAPPLGTVTNADAAQKASAQTMKDSYGKLQASNSSAQAALDALDKMMGLAAKKSPLLTAGPLGTNQSAINPDAAEYEKQRANLIAQLAQQNGTNGTDAGRALTGESVPDFGKPKAAIADGLGTLRNQTVVQQLKASLLTPIYQAGDSKKYTTLENQFDQNIAPSMVPLLTMPPGPQRAAALTQAYKDKPALRAKLNWAAENGLLK